MKKDIFNGKIKKEYFSYILTYMIFFVALFIGAGILCMYAFLWGMIGNSFEERLLIAIFGAISFILAVVYLFLELLVIRNYPKYQKLRRILFNSDCYFTENDTKEYYGRYRRRDRAASEVVTSFAEAEKGMGDKKPIRYRVYCGLSILMCLLEFASLITMMILGDNIALRPEMLQDDKTLCVFFLLVSVLCIALAIYFLTRAYKVAVKSSFDNWSYALYNSLIDISVRRNNKKLKFWYEIKQLNEIENMVRYADESAELKLERKGDRIFSFHVIDTLNDRVVFTGLFQ